MITAISPYSIIDVNNRLYTACNLVTTITLLAIKQISSLSFSAFGLLGITTVITNYCIFDTIATSSLSNKKKFIPLQIVLLSFIVLGSAITHIALLSPVFFLSEILYKLINAKLFFCIADLPLYMLLLSIICSPVQTVSESIHLLKGNITTHNRLLQELHLINGSSSQRSIDSVTSAECFQFIVSLVLEAVTRGLREEAESQQNTVVFEHSPVLAPYLIVPIDENTTPTLNPSRFLEISEDLQALPQEIEFQQYRETVFQTLLDEFQKLTIDLQKKYYTHIVQYHDLQWIVPNELRAVLQEYQSTQIVIGTDVDQLITTGVSFTKEMLQFARRQPHLRTLHELREIMSRYIYLQSLFRESLSQQPENTNARKRITSLINSLYLLYEENISPIRFQFPEDTSNDDMTQPAWNFLATKFPRDFFTYLPTHLFSNTEDPDELDKDFKKYELSTAEELITKVFDSDIIVFRESSKEQVIEKLIHYCTTNAPSNPYKIQFLKLRDQAYKIIKISTAIFSTIVAPILMNPLEFAMGAVYAILSKRRSSPAVIDNVSTSLFEGFFLSISSLGSMWAGCQFTSRYIVPLMD